MTLVTGWRNRHTSFLLLYETLLINQPSRECCIPSDRSISLPIQAATESERHAVSSLWNVTIHYISRTVFDSPYSSPFRKAVATSPTDISSPSSDSSDMATIIFTDEAAGVGESRAHVHQSTHGVRRCPITSSRILSRPSSFGSGFIRRRGAFSSFNTRSRSSPCSSTIRKSSHSVELKLVGLQALVEWNVEFVSLHYFMSSQVVMINTGDMIHFGDVYLSDT